MPIPSRSGRTSRLPLLAALGAIGVAVGGTAAAFAYTAGWIGPARLTAGELVDALSERGGNPIGHRRNHAEGVCFSGSFIADGAGARLSIAPMFVAGSYPVIGRFAIATGNPDASDASTPVRSMAIRIVAPDGEEWRSGMNNSPVFVVATPQAFYQLTRATDIDPRTGKPDPAAVARFFATHPETDAFTHWAGTFAWTTSWADQTYNSLDAFRFIDAAGHSRLVRWSMVPTVPPDPVPKAEIARLGPDFLTRDLFRRLARGPLRWHLVVTLAQPGDPGNDATRAWPADRQHVTIGTLVVRRAEAEADGPCRDYNYDPLILPQGIAASNDPLLAARSAAYANSFDRRTAEAAAYPHAPGAEAGQ